MYASINGDLSANNYFYTPRVVFQYLDANGALLDDDTWFVDAGFSPFSSRDNLRDVFKVRVKLGDNDIFGNLLNVVSKTYSLGPAVGDAECAPFATTAGVNDVAVASLRWTVPGAGSWHSLDAIDVRLIDDNGEILQVRWNEASNDFFLYDADSHQYRGPAQPGSNDRFERPEVAMLLSNTQVAGSGPLGPSVALNLGLRFKPKAAGRVFRIEARASDKSGTAQGWVSAGTIAVAKH
jgi:hypothetical protein